MNLLQLQLDNAIANGRMAMRVERDKRDWLEQAIDKGHRELSACSSRRRCAA